MRIVRLPRPWLVLLIVMAVAAAAGAGWALREAMEPKVYFISNISFKRMVRGGVSKKMIARLDPVEGQYFTSEDELMSAMRDLVGDRAFQRHERVMRKSLRTKSCWANISPRALHTPSPSTEHRLYAALESVPVVPATALPPIPTQAAFLPDSEGMLVLGKFGDVVHLGPDFVPRARFRLPGVYQGDGDQGALGLDPESIVRSNEVFAPAPDLVLLFVTSPEECLKRIEESREGFSAFEKIDYLKKVQEIFDSFSRPEIKRIDSDREKDEVHADVVREAKQALELS